MLMIAEDLQLDYFQETKMNNYETYDKMVKGMCLSPNDNINSTFARNCV